MEMGRNSCASVIVVLITNDSRQKNMLANWNRKIIRNSRRRWLPSGGELVPSSIDNLRTFQSSGKNSTVNWSRVLISNLGYSAWFIT